MCIFAISYFIGPILDSIYCLCQPHGGGSACEMSVKVLSQYLFTYNKGVFDTVISGLLSKVTKHLTHLRDRKYVWRMTFPI